MHRMRRQHYMLRMWLLHTRRRTVVGNIVAIVLIVGALATVAAVILSARR